MADEDLLLSSDGLPADVFGYFLMSQSTAFVPNFGGSDGNLCLGSPQLRFASNVLDSGASGSVSMQVDFQDLPQNAVFSPGDTWYFQLWYRDGPTCNTTAGVQVDFCN